MAETFQIGDVVMLKSGGPLMTVESVHDNGSYVCLWFNNDSKSYSLQTNVFKAGSLKKYN